ncbi:MAG TPA: UvrB/UvrC motif-containing protein, partial [bacterium]|nr:UvrB/UvrC motif-containing protein [bacterium]
YRPKGDGPFPALALVRGRTRSGGEYYGPFTDVWALRRSLRNLRRVFPVAACRRRIDPARPVRPCLDHSLGRCLAPCAGLVTAAEYDRTVRALRAFFQGRNPALVRELKSAMAEASRRLEFERAARLRDELEALQRVARHPRGLSRKFGRELPADRRVLKLKERLGLEKEPLRIEAYDISNLFGSEAVGSMVTFLAGSPYRDGYRRFRIRGVRGSDDYAMLAEVLRRRFSETGWPKPDLVLVDGGRGQVETARRVMKEVGVDLPLVGLAKKFERFFVAGRRLPLPVPPESPEGLFLRQVRDEAHRFAVGYHRRLRSRKLTASWLDEIPGLGPVNRARLRRAFPSAAAIRAATVEDLAAAGIRPELARRVKEAAGAGPG